MANESYIKNTKKYSPQKTLEVMQKELQAKFNLSCTTSHETIDDYEYLEVKIKDLIIPFYLNPDNRFAFYDTPGTSFFKGNSDNQGKYAENFRSYLAMIEYFSVYAYLHQYLIHFLADKMKVQIDSDGAGKIKPFYSPKYQSYKTWFSYWSTDYLSKNPVVKALLPAPENIKLQELDYFPELKF